MEVKNLPTHVRESLRWGFHHHLWVDWILVRPEFFERLITIGTDPFALSLSKGRRRLSRFIGLPLSHLSSQRKYPGRYVGAQVHPRSTALGGLQCLQVPQCLSIGQNAECERLARDGNIRSQVRGELQK